MIILIHFLLFSKKYPISLALRMSLDAESVVQWGKSLQWQLAVIPVMILFFCGAEIFL